MAHFLQFVSLKRICGSSVSHKPQLTLRSREQELRKHLAESDGFECVDVVLDLGKFIGFGPDDGYDIETSPLMQPAVPLQKRQGRSSDFFLLGGRDRLGGMTGRRGRTGFHFDEDNRVSIPRDQIQLPEPSAKLAMENCVAEFFQKPSRFDFAPVTKLLSGATTSRQQPGKPVEHAGNALQNDKGSSESHGGIDRPSEPDVLASGSVLPNNGDTHRHMQTKRILIATGRGVRPRYWARPFGSPDPIGVHAFSLAFALA